VAFDSGKNVTPLKPLQAVADPDPGLVFMPNRLRQQLFLDFRNKRR
jgi:hypothetical protein